jgi:putative MATE family efflux protein
MYAEIETVDHAPPSPPGPMLLPSTVWNLAWPVILTYMSQALVGLVDVVAISRHGPLAIAAVSGGVRLLLFTQAIFIGVTTGTTALVARHWGAGRRVDAANVSGASLIAAGAIGLVVSSLVAVFAGSLSALLGLTGDAAILGERFIRTSAFTLAGFPFYHVVDVSLRAAGDTRTSFKLAVCTHALNILLLLLLVPSYSVYGTATANALSFAAAALVSVSLWLSGRFVLPPPSWAGDLVARVRQIIRIGYRGGVENAIWQGGLLLFTVILGHAYGPAEVAAYGVGISILAFTIYVGMGIGVAAGTLVGQSLGAGNPEAATRAGWISMRIALVIMGSLGLLLTLGSSLIARAILSEPRIIGLTTTVLIVLGLSQPMMAIEFSLGGALRGSGDTRTPLVATLTGMLVARVGLAATLIFFEQPVEFVYAVLLVDYAIKCVLLLSRYRTRPWERAIAI